MNKKNVLLMTTACTALLLAGCGKKGGVQDYSKNMELAAYTGLSIDRYVGEITDDDVQAYIEGDLLPNSEYNSITDRAAEEGDIVSFDYDATIDGQPFDGSSDTDVEVELGTDNFLLDAEKEMVGMNVGEEKTFDVVMPEDYDGVVDGKTATYTVKLNSIIEVVLPEYNDEFVASISDYSTVAEYEAAIRDQLQQEYDEDATSSACEDALYMIMEGTTFKEIPDDLMNACRTAMEAEDKQTLEMFGLDDISDIYGEDFDQDAYLEEMAHEQMVVCTIAAKEGLQITDEDYQASLEENMELEGYLSAEDYEASIPDVDSYKYQLLRQKVMDFIADNNTFVDISEDEYFDFDFDDEDWGDFEDEDSVELDGIASLVEEVDDESAIMDEPASDTEAE